MSASYLFLSVVIMYLSEIILISFKLIFVLFKICVILSKSLNINVALLYVANLLANPIVSALGFNFDILL